MRDKKLWITVALLVINTFIVLFALGVKDAWNAIVFYEEFSEIPKEGTYKIETVEDYIKFAETVSMGNSYKNCEIILMEDLDFQHVEKIPVAGSGEEITTFFGTFNGNGHKICGVDMNVADGDAALFADLGGMVLNLTLKESQFTGQVCAGIAVELKSGGSILNCYVDAECDGELAGTLAGRLRGYLFNCVATGDTLYGERRGAYVEQCYLENGAQYVSAVDETIVLNVSTVIEQLNAYLPRVSAFHNRLDMLKWSGENVPALTDEKAVLLEEVLVETKINKKRTILKAYYSHHQDHWSVALPPGLENVQMTVYAKNTNGKTERFKRHAGEQTILYTDGQYQYFIDFLMIQDADTILIDLGENKSLNDVYQNKRKEFPGFITKIDAQGNVENEYLKAFYGHGNDSWEADKKSYNLKFESETDFLGLGADDDYALLAAYRDDSLMCYITTTTMNQNLDFPYALDFKLMNLYVNGEYLGVYFLVEKIELSKTRIDISSVYEEMKKEYGKKLETYSFESWKDSESLAERYYYNVENNPKDLTGGYLLELDVSDYDETASRFVTSRGNRYTMKRANYSSKEQVNYIADYWQEFEDALYSETGYNHLGKYYTEYIDLESFAKQWLMYELTIENSMASSVYFYKESDVTGDGLLHACFPWDMEHSYLTYSAQNEMWLKDSLTSNRYWSRFWIHEDFREEVRRLWNEEFLEVIAKMVAEEPSNAEDSMKNISWYKESLVNIAAMERSRWWKMNPIERCEVIRDFLNTRVDALSVLLFE